MKKQVRIPTRLLAVGSAFILAAGALVTGLTAGAAGPTSVSLQSATSFAVLAGDGITNTGPTTINGDVGSFAITTQTGFASVVLTGTNHAGDAVTQGAKTDLTAAYIDAAGRTPVTLVPTELGNTTLIPGVYTASSGTFGLTGNVTLDGQGDPTAVFIFKTASTLITATGSSVSLIGAAQSCNVFWQVGSSATLGGSTVFQGTIMALTSITLVTGASINGRALARNGAVTLDTNRITASTCAVAAPPAPAPVATATPTPTASPSAVPTATATPAPVAAIPATAAPVAKLPSTSTQDLDGVPTWAFVLSLAAFGLLAMRVRARDRRATAPKV